jgi:hypothetical protein
MSGRSPQEIDDKFEMGVGARKWESYGEGDFIGDDLRLPSPAPVEEIEMQPKQ